MIIDHVMQQAAEKKIYTIDYAQWLVSSEELVDVTTSIDPVGTSPDLTADAIILANKTGVELTVSGGETLNQYSVSMNVTTNNGQIKADCLLFSIYSTCDGAG